VNSAGTKNPEPRYQLGQPLRDLAGVRRVPKRRVFLPPIRPFHFHKFFVNTNNTPDFPGRAAGPATDGPTHPACGARLQDNAGRDDHVSRPAAIRPAATTSPSRFAYEPRPCGITKAASRVISPTNRLLRQRRSRTIIILQFTDTESRFQRQWQSPALSVRAAISMPRAGWNSLAGDRRVSLNASVAYIDSTYKDSLRRRHHLRRSADGRAALSGVGSVRDYVVARYSPALPRFILQVPIEGIRAIRTSVVQGKLPRHTDVSTFGSAP